MPMNYGDPETLLYEFDAKREGEKVVITTEEMEVGAFLKILVNRGARVQVYSAHDFPGEFGR
jgi:hypothetical protein